MAGQGAPSCLPPPSRDWHAPPGQVDRCYISAMDKDELEDKFTVIDDKIEELWKALKITMLATVIGLGILCSLLR